MSCTRRDKGPGNPTGTAIDMVIHDVEEAVFLSRRISERSPRPGRVTAEVPVPFPPGGQRALLRERAFQDLCLEIDDLLRSEPAPLGT